MIPRNVGRRPAGRSCRQAARLVLAGLLAWVAGPLACSDDGATGPVPGALAGRAFVVNSVGGTLSVVGRGADGRLTAENDAVELGPAANAVALAVDEDVIAVPDGATSRLLLFEASTLAPRCIAALPPGSSPNSVALGGGKAYVSLLIGGTVARVDLASCSVEDVKPVGAAPADLEILGADVVVVVSNIDLLSPGIPRLGPGYVAFVNAQTLALEDTVETGGFNPQLAALDKDGDLLVVNTGDFGGGNSSLAVIDLVARRFQAAFPIGDSAVDVAVSPSNLAYVSSFSDGLYVFDASDNVVLRGASNPLTIAPRPNGQHNASGVAVDRRGNVLFVYPGDFASPGEVFLFDSDGELTDSTAVGIGPIGIQLEPSARED